MFVPDLCISMINIVFLQAREYRQCLPTTIQICHYMSAYYTSSGCDLVPEFKAVARLLTHEEGPTFRDSSLFIIPEIITKIMNAPLRC